MAALLGGRLRTWLLASGIVASVLYVAMNVFVPLQWESYDTASQTVSELSAIDAPTRALWIWLGIVYALLMTAFGYGVWASAVTSRPLRISGGLLVAYGIIGLGWPLAPMHSREALAAHGPTLTDTMHLAFTAVTVALMLLAMGFGAAAFRKHFRIYSLATVVLLVAFGALTGREAPLVEANQPTPWIGLWERLNIGLFLLWVVVLAAALLRGSPGSKPADS